MHNLNRSSFDVEHGIDNTKKKLGDDKKKFIDAENLKSCHEEYDKKASTHTLNTLKPKWDEKVTDKRTLAYGLYGSNRPVIKNHWKELERQNGNRSIICPFCGLSAAVEMDHFVPRGKEKLFPEYSTHYTNLIPLCHQCNHDKGDDWVDANGDQIFFNAYYDLITGIEIFKCDIIEDGDTGILSSVIELNLTGTEGGIEKRILNTIERLGLLRKLSEDSNKILRSRMSTIQAEYRFEISRYKSVEEFIGSKQNVLVEAMKDTSQQIEAITIAAIISSAEFWDTVTR